LQRDFSNATPAMRIVAIGKTVSALESVCAARALRSLHFPTWSNAMGRTKKKSPCQLSPFSELDNHLSVLESQGAPSDDVWQAFECLPVVPSPLDSAADRQCWWQHLYAIIERHGLGVAHGAPTA
jgi:hypothetical protein